MKRVAAIVFGAAAIVIGGFMPVGCGSDSSVTDESTADAGLFDCRSAGGACTGGAECCSSNCDLTTNTCTDSFGFCGAPDSACTSGTQCCKNSCVDGKCADQQCTADNAACTTDAQCCGGKCSAGACTPLSTTCRTSGNPCALNGECCSNFCSQGLCKAPSFCSQSGDACGNDTDCCGGLCTKQAGAALGLCGTVNVPGVGGCTPAGQTCAGGATFDGGALPDCGGECCSRSCRPFATTGVLVCQPPSGCRPTGELCVKDADCCGSAGSPGSTNQNGGMQTTDVVCAKNSGQTYGRCDNGKACSPAGAICRLSTNSCNATDRCCAGTVQTHPLNCKQDSLGIPRCTAESDVDCTVSGPKPAGTACASSADCCGVPCVPNPAGTPAFVCGAAACMPTGGACTTTADCCAGSPCTIPPGQIQGTCGSPGSTGPGPGTNCAQYGQACTTAADCCNAVPCTRGFCILPGPN